HPECNRDTFALYEKRRNILIEGLNELGWRLPKPKATLYAWVPVPPGYSSTDFAKALLEKAGVLVVPGLAYGEHGEGYVRFSLTVAGDMHGERIAEGVRRIKENLKIRW
ncbi:MAG: aminotransferase class I/II-fold pyridoxal phosphate-dependent enzyme, partial [Armatimonadota bacterium]